MTMARGRRAAALGAALALVGCGQILGPKATLGPGSIVRGRGLYNDVINETNNEQTLESIVRMRYGEPLAMMSVASITANLRASATSEAQFGFGAPKTYEGNLVPLTIGAAYEENPTISYAPVQGERYAKNILAPVGLDVLVLLLNTEHAPAQLLSVLVKHLNGLPNPLYGSPETRVAFRDSIALLGRLQDAGLATWIATEAKGFALVIHDYAPANQETVRALLRSWNVPERAMRTGRSVVLPVRLAVGTPDQPGLNVQTRSVYELLEIAGLGVDVPTEHAERGLVDRADPDASPLRGLFAVHSSRSRPTADVLVAARHRGYWFYVAADDGPSKLMFRLLQSLIGMRLVDVAPHTIPTLTIPVK